MRAAGAWFELRELFAARGVRFTFFVTRYHSLTGEARGQLAALAADGHSTSASARACARADRRRRVAGASPSSDPRG